MTARIIDGKALAAEYKSKLKQQLDILPETPFLAVVLVGDDPASIIYDRNKQKAALEVGIGCEIIHLPENTSEAELLSLIDRLNEDGQVHGILVQLPLPRHIDSIKVLGRIRVDKDVDGFNPHNVGLLNTQTPGSIISATPLGIMEVIRQTGISLRGKHAVIIGSSNIVGRPLAALLLNHDCTVTVTHIHTTDIEKLTLQADILVAACGCAKLVKKNWVKPGAIVIDVGINRENGKICGDVDFEEVKKVASWITPVPGGVGPMTIALLLDNTYQAFLKQKGLKK